MYSLYTRVNSILAFSAMTLSILALLNVFSTLWLPESTPSINLKLDSIDHVRRIRYNDEAFVKFDLVANLSTMWNWNVKQFYVSVAVEYPHYSETDTDSSAAGNIVVWDRIITNKKSSDFQATGVHNRYRVTDKAGSISGASAVFRCRVHTVPIFGVLTRKDWISEPFTFPEAQ